MAVKPIPDGYHTLTPYLVVPGVAKLIDFLKQTFDAEEIERHAGPDGGIMHAEVRIGDSVVMMAEPTSQWGPRPATIYAYVKDVDAVYKRALRAGATSLMEPANQFYGDRNGGIQDLSGNQWWIATRVENVSREELAKRAAEHAKAAQAK